MNFEGIKSRFPLKDNGKGTKEEYFWAVDTFVEESKKGNIELYAGDCELEEIKEYFESKKIFFMKHFIKHKDSDEYFYLGFDCAGNPVGYMTKYLPKNLSLICRNKAGTFFKKQ